VRKDKERWLLSPRDLIAELECSQRLHLDWSVLEGSLEAPPKDNGDELEMLIDQGKAHEAMRAERQREAGTYLSIGEPSFTPEALTVAAAKTKKATEDGIETIHQATFFHDGFMGFADFLILRKDENGKPLRDEQGRYVYDPVDAKSARSAKRAAVLQVAAYALAMVESGYAQPLEVHLWLGGEKDWSAPALDLMDLAEEFRTRARNRIESFETPPTPLWSYPRESCGRCRWQKLCVKGREDDRDLSLIQNIRSNTRNLLINAGIRTIDQMAVATDEQRPRQPKEVSIETFNTLREQAEIQVRGTDPEHPIFEAKDSDALGLMPEESAGDIWFDMEGDPFAENGDGLEYMFGYLYRSGSGYAFHTFDAVDRPTEKQAFIDFITYVLERRKQYPDMHIYHYAAYELSAMLRLAQRHSVFEFEVDALVREGVFVDLYSIVRKAFKFSTTSMSIKYIEKVYWDGKRDEGVTNAVGSVIQFEKALIQRQQGNLAAFDAALAEIKSYNEDDVDSTRQLDHWIRAQALKLGVSIADLRPTAAMKWSDEEELEREEPIALQLLAKLPANREEWSDDHYGISLLAASISYHHREKRPAWWKLFDFAGKSVEELEASSEVIVPTAISAGPWGKEGRQRNERRTIIVEAEGVDLSHVIDPEKIPQILYEVAPEGFKIIQGSTRGFATTKITSIDGSSLTIEEVVKTGQQTWDYLPMAILPGAPIPTRHIEAVLRDQLGASTISRIDGGLPPFAPAAWTDVLLRRPPRQRSGALVKTGNSVEDIALSLADSEGSYVAVQGPPGTGKTYVGAHVIAHLVEAGWKIGVVAQSHAVVENLMDSVRGIDSKIPMAKKARSDKAMISYHQDDVASWAAMHASRGYVIGGTVWTFSRNEVRSLGLDLIVIDEAGQFSLANSLVVISAAARALLLGDPQQLPQVSQGSHPEPVNESVLSHLLHGRKTMPDDLGYFLETTYRLHPTIAQPVSRLQYEDRLHSDARCAKRNLDGVTPGLHIVHVEHIGNTVKSDEEGDELIARVPQLLGRAWIDTDSKGNPVAPRPLVESDILVVTGYNAQVRYLKSRLASAGYYGIRVGTVDKFQGQEAPVVFVSMATSSSEDLPRGIEFLLSPNRLNVAISRAEWACYVLRSPHLSIMEPVSPDGMVMLGKFVTLCKGR
jgi:predicted RecB family nuclease